MRDFDERDDLVVAYLRERGQVEPPPYLAEAVWRAALGEPQRRRGWLALATAWAPLAGGVAAAAVIGIAILVALSVANSPVGAPSASPVPTPPDGARPSGTPQPDGIRPGDLVALVAGAPVDVFAEPAAGGQPIWAIQPDERLLVTAEPVLAPGATWYRVEYTVDGLGAFGWISAGAGAEAEGVSLESTDPRCPGASPTVAALVALAAEERATCYADTTVAIGEVVTASDDRLPVAEQGEPAWLAHDDGLRLYGTTQGPTTAAGLPVHVDPGSGIELPLGEPITVTGRFQHPAASGCTAVPSDGAAPDAREMETWCRQQFVVSTVQPAAP
jgi:hypothetical protein